MTCGLVKYQLRLAAISEEPNKPCSSPEKSMKTIVESKRFPASAVAISNTVLLPDDVAGFARLVQFRDLAEDRKPEDRKKLAGRIMLMHDVISAGIRALLNEAGGPNNEGL